MDTIEARALTVRLGGREILHGVDFTARAGALTIIAGPNGSGKTTLMRALTGDLRYGGSIRFAGAELSRLGQAALARQRAVLTQEVSIAFPFTVGEIIRLGIQASPVVASDPSRRIEEALARVGLPGYAGRFYHELSGGERQRTQLARVLCQIWEPVLDGKARWLFLDEPISSLDIRHQIAMMELVRDHVRAGGGAIAVMHDLNLSAMFGDNVMLLRRGDVIAAGRPSEVFTDENLARTFDCALRVGAAPENGLFVLPQSALARL